MENITTENKNMKEALTKARNDNEELQEEVVLKEVKMLFLSFSFSLYYIAYVFIWVELYDGTWTNNLAIQIEYVHISSRLN